MTPKRIVVGLAALSIMLVSSLASAQAKKAGAAEAKDDKGYGYTFDDDPLAAGGFGPGDATIRVRPGAVRTTLIRPRTSFVTEMLKSVENLLERRLERASSREEDLVGWVQSRPGERVVGALETGWSAGGEVRWAATLT